jgi:hypothetical protein
MRVILIVFAVLLILLTFLGAFGGSIYQKEPFFIDSSVPDMTGPETITYSETPEPYENSQLKDEFYNVPNSTPMVLDEQPKRFLEDGFNIEPFEEDEPTASMPALY